MDTYKTIIIGAGPIGLTCGIEAEKKGFSYLILEKGCLVNSIYNYPVNMTFFSTSDRLEIGGVPFVSHGDKPTRREALEYYRRTAHAWNLNIHTYETVISIKKNGERFDVVTNKSTYKSESVIISTGFYGKPNLMNIPGENLPKVMHYYTEAHPYAYQKVAVTGAGNSSVDVALETYRHGADVTMIIREDKLKDSVKYWVKPDIENRIKEGTIKSYFNSEIVEIKEKEIVVKTPSGIVNIENDFVFAMTGYHPDYSFLESCGVKIERENDNIPFYDPETFETNVRNLFLAGVVCSGVDTGKWFIENSRQHAVNIFNELEKRIQLLHNNIK